MLVVFIYGCLHFCVLRCRYV